MGEKSSNVALYRVYRSKSLDEIIGQDHITGTLKKALKKGQIAHAYLFSGPRGVGKTSVARILAHQINGLKYEESLNHLDIIEIDAASNRGIDEIRDLREKAYISPASAKYKVYIIDEVHMLTTPAFNALLKLLEEPPAHVVLMLATTEVHKLPETIVSRTQRFSFKLIKNGVISLHLQSIADKEKVAIEKDALDMIAAHAYGSLRDAISLFDQVRAHSSQKSIDVEITADILGLVPKSIVEDLLSAIISGSPEKVISILESSRDLAFSSTQLAQQIMDTLRQKNHPNLSSIKLMEDLLFVAPSYDPQVKLEAVLIRYALESSSNSNQPISKSDSTKTAENNVSMDEIKINSEVNHPIESNQATSKGDFDKPKEANWQAVLDEIKKVNKSLYAVLRLANPKINQESLYLEFNFPFHKQRADEARNKQLLDEIINKIFGTKLTIRTQVVEKASQATEEKVDSVSNVINVMGGGSIMEYEDG